MSRYIKIDSWQKLKDFVNTLTEAQLKQQVFINVEDSYTRTEAGVEIISEDLYRSIKYPEEETYTKSYAGGDFNAEDSEKIFNTGTILIWAF